MAPDLLDLPGRDDHLELCLRLAALAITEVAPGVRAHGPAPAYDARIRALHERGLAG